MIDNKKKLKIDILKFLQKNQLAVIGTTSVKGQAQVATITYLFDDDFHFYFITRKSSRKYNNITHNKNIGIVVGVNPDVPATVQMQGTASIIQNPDHFVINYLSKTINLDEKKWWPLFKARGIDYAFIEVKIEWLRWLDLDATGYPETYSEDFQQIIP
jgi:general stress protein 26